MTEKALLDIRTIIIHLKLLKDILLGRDKAQIPVILKKRWRKRVRRADPPTSR
jgi:hypothetical protein